MNGLIRQLFPKKMCFDSITPDQVAFAMYRLHHRPRNASASRLLTKFL
jgi:IS30 family transposase